MILKKTDLLRDAVKQMTEAEQPMDEADLIFKPGTTTAGETRDLVDAQLNNNAAGLELFQADCSGDACKAQSFLSA